MKRCDKCKIEKPFSDFAKNRAFKDGLQKRCKPCGREDNRDSYLRNKEKHKERYEENHEEIRSRQKRYRAEHAEDYKRIADRYRSSVRGRSKQMWKGAQVRAKKNSIFFDLSYEKIERAVARGFCERTAIPFDLRPHPKKQNNPFAPSLDKIDPFGPYTDDNVQVVCVAYNIGKNQMTDEEYIMFCKCVVEFNK